MYRHLSSQRLVVVEYLWQLALRQRVLSHTFNPTDISHVLKLLRSACPASTSKDIGQQAPVALRCPRFEPGTIVCLFNTLPLL